jgi:hypothetical protein
MPEHRNPNNRNPGPQTATGWCARCRRTRPNVKFDRGCRLHLCAKCWFENRPAHDTAEENEPGSSEPCEGK